MIKPSSGHSVLVTVFALALASTSQASLLAYDPFDHAAAAPLTSLSGGSGWAGAWTQDGQSCVTGQTGLGYADAAGNVLNVAGKCADTTGSATTRSFRSVASGPLTGVWISFLYQLPASNAKFEGISFYRGTQALFSINNSSADATATISLGNSVGGTAASTRKGTFGTTHFVVLHLIDGGAADSVDTFVDPLLSATPTIPDATITAANFGFDTIRIAGQDGSTLLIDEFRVGNTFSDVSPYSGPLPDDTDGDGLTDAQETVLGLNPTVSDAALIAAIRSHPEFFDLHDAAGILALGRGRPVLQKTGDSPVNITIEVQSSDNLKSWRGLQTFNRSVALPEGKNFLRVGIATP